MYFTKTAIWQKSSKISSNHSMWWSKTHSNDQYREFSTVNYCKFYDIELKNKANHAQFLSVINNKRMTHFSLLAFKSSGNGCEYFVIEISKKIWPHKMCKTHHCALWLRYQQIHTTTNLLLLYPEWDCSEFSSIKEKFDSIWYLKESIRKLLSQNAHFCVFYW